MRGCTRYKARGTIQTDANGTRDNVEFLNIAQDDALSWPRPTHRTYPSTVNTHMKDTVIPFVRKSMDVNYTILAIFERQLGLPRGALASLHSTEEPCGSEARCIKTPPNQSSTGVGAHTDFGTLVRHLSVVGDNLNDVSVSLDVPPQPFRRTTGHATRYTEVAIHQGELHIHTNRR